MYFTPEDFFNVFIRLLSQVFSRDAPGISEKDENRSKSTKVTKVISETTQNCIKMQQKKAKSEKPIKRATQQSCLSVILLLGMFSCTTNYAG